jgi:hypothetical protein
VAKTTKQRKKDSAKLGERPASAGEAQTEVLLAKIRALPEQKRAVLRAELVAFREEQRSRHSQFGAVPVPATEPFEERRSRLLAKMEPLKRELDEVNGRIGRLAFNRSRFAQPSGPRRLQPHEVRAYRPQLWPLDLGLLADQLRADPDCPEHLRLMVGLANVARFIDELECDLQYRLGGKDERHPGPERDNPYRRAFQHIAEIATNGKRDTVRFARLRNLHLVSGKRPYDLLEKLLPDNEKRTLSSEQHVDEAKKIEIRLGIWDGNPRTLLAKSVREAAKSFALRQQLPGAGEDNDWGWFLRRSGLQQQNERRMAADPDQIKAFLALPEQQRTQLAVAATHHLFPLEHHDALKKELEIFERVAVAAHQQLNKKARGVSAPGSVYTQRS